MLTRSLCYDMSQATSRMVHVGSFMPARSETFEFQIVQLQPLWVRRMLATVWGGGRAKQLHDCLRYAQQTADCETVLSPAAFSNKPTAVANSEKHEKTHFPIWSGRDAALPGCGADQETDRPCYASLICHGFVSLASPSFKGQHSVEVIAAHARQVLFVCRARRLKHGANSRSAAGDDAHTRLPLSRCGQESDTTTSRRGSCSGCRILRRSFAQRRAPTSQRRTVELMKNKDQCELSIQVESCRFIGMCRLCTQSSIGISRPSGPIEPRLSFAARNRRQVFC